MLVSFRGKVMTGASGCLIALAVMLLWLVLATVSVFATAVLLHPLYALGSWIIGWF